MIVFDIETAPLPDEQTASFMPEFTAPGNYKDQEKIAAYIEGEKARWKDQAALSPLTGRVIAIGLLVDGEVIISTELDEPMMLKKFWADYKVDIAGGEFYVGFNIFHFDLPFLIRRSIAIGVEVPFGIMPACKFWENQFVDVMQGWQCGNKQERISLDNFAKFLGVGKKEGSGKDFAKLLKENPDKAKEYLGNDLWLTQKIFCRVYGNYKPERKAA